MLTILTFVNFSAFVTDINSAFGVEITGSGAEVFLLWVKSHHVYIHMPDFAFMEPVPSCKTSHSFI